MLQQPHFDSLTPRSVMSTPTTITDVDEYRRGGGSGQLLVQQPRLPASRTICSARRRVVRPNRDAPARKLQMLPLSLACQQLDLPPWLGVTLRRAMLAREQPRARAGLVFAAPFVDRDRGAPRQLDLSMGMGTAAHGDGLFGKHGLRPVALSGGQLLHGPQDAMRRCGEPVGQSRQAAAGSGRRA